MQVFLTLFFNQKQTFMKKTKHLFMLFASVFAINVNAQESSPIPKSFENAAVPTTEQQSTVAQPEAEKEKLDEVVVTALGIKRDKKSLGYAVQEVDNKLLTAVQNPDPLGSLSGKISGLNVTTSTGDPGAGTYLQLRGATSLSLSNQPLIVIDGMPVDNSSSSTGNNPNDGFNAQLQGSTSTTRGMDINPNDIESVSVLKGTAAAAIYGTRGSAGVILITTKRGKLKKKSFAVDYNGTIGFDIVNKLPDMQNTYVQGSGGEIQNPRPSASGSWGPSKDSLYWKGNYSPTSTTAKWDKNGELITQSQYNALSDADKAKASKFTPYNNQDIFFKTGITTTHTISVMSSTEKTSNRLSLGYTNQTGIIPLADYQKFSANYNTDYQITDKFLAQVGVIYSNIETNRTQHGSNTSGIMLGLLRTPISFDNSNGLSNAYNKPEAYSFADGTQRSYRGGGGYDNPFWTINKNNYLEKTNRAVGNLFLSYNFLPELKLSNRIGVDFYSTQGQQNVGINSRAYPTGSIAYGNEKKYILEPFAKAIS